MRWSLVPGALALGFVLACTGGDVPAPTPRPAPPPAPAPAPPPAPEPPKDTDTDTDPDAAAAEDGTPGEAPAEGTPEGENWCCEYTGPLGTTQALLDNPKACTDQFGDKGGKFVQGNQCAAVCCKYAKDPADLAKGYETETVAAGNCTMRKGTIDETACAATPPRPRATPAPAPGRLTRPGTGDRSPSPAPRPGGGSPAEPKPGRITRPGG